MELNSLVFFFGALFLTCSHEFWQMGSHVISAKVKMKNSSITPSNSLMCLLASNLPLLPVTVKSDMFSPLPFYLLQSISLHYKPCKTLCKSPVSVLDTMYHNIITFFTLSCCVGFWASYFHLVYLRSFVVCVPFYHRIVVHCMDGLTVCLPI